MAARINRTDFSEKWRERIKSAKIIEKLAKHVNGEINMQSTQIRAAEILLKKVIPDLSKSDVDNHHDGKLQIEIIKSF